MRWALRREGIESCIFSPCIRTSGVLGLRVVQRTSLTFSTFCFWGRKKQQPHADLQDIPGEEWNIHYRPGGVMCSDTWRRCDVVNWCSAVQVVTSCCAKCKLFYWLDSFETFDRRVTLHLEQPQLFRRRLAWGWLVVIFLCRCDKLQFKVWLTGPGDVILESVQERKALSCWV